MHEQVDKLTCNRIVQVNNGFIVLFKQSHNSVSLSLSLRFLSQLPSQTHCRAVLDRRGSWGSASCSAGTCSSSLYDPVWPHNQGAIPLSQRGRGVHRVIWAVHGLPGGVQPAPLPLQISYKCSQIQKFHSQEVFPAHVSGSHCYPEQLVPHPVLLAAGKLFEVDRLWPWMKNPKFQVKVRNYRAWQDQNVTAVQLPICPRKTSKGRVRKSWVNSN